MHVPFTPKRWKDRLLLSLVLIAGCLLTVLAGTALKEAEELRARELQGATNQLVLSAFDRDLNRTIEAVRGTALMIESHQALEREQFNGYVTRILENLQCIHIVEWQPLVAASGLAAFEARARATGLPEYRVVQPNSSGTAFEPVHGRSEYVPVLYAWPQRYGTLGYDMSFSPQRMESKLQSRVVGQPVASGVFEIMQDGQVTSGAMGIAISTPVYRSRQAVVGYLAAVIDLPSLFQEAALRADAAKLDMLVYDLGSPDSKPIFSALGADSDLADQTISKNGRLPQDYASTVDFARAAWEVVLHPRPSFYAGLPLRFSTLVSLAGLLTTLVLLMAMVRVQSSRRKMEQAQTLTQQASQALAQERLRILELNESLERRVEERGAQLQTAMQTLQDSQEELTRSEARATLSTLIASVSHELSTPMGNSMMAASTLTDEIPQFQAMLESGQLRRSDLAQFAQKVSDGNALVQRNLERAVELLRNFRQVAADQASEQRRHFDLRQTLKEVLDTLAPSLKTKPHQVTLEVPEGIAMDSYPGPLGQVVINLINNAYLHAFDGLASGGVFSVTATASADAVQLDFSDNGRGIGAATLGKMFEPFFSTKIGQGGTGLGMSIVENLVTQTLGGSISVQSTLGVGTAFHIRLPLHAPNPNTNAYAAPTDETSSFAATLQPKE